MREESLPFMAGSVNNSCLSVGCTNPDDYFFWDDLHPTTTAHNIVGELAFSALESKPVPEPATALGVLALGTLGASLYRRGTKVN